MENTVKSKAVKPPLGLTPKRVHDEMRLVNIYDAVNRYFNVNKAIPIEWIEEYNDLIKNLK